MQVSSIWSETIEEPPSCVAFCPTRPDLFVIGTYLLHKTDEVIEASSESNASSAPQKRTGKLLLYRLNGRSLERIQMIETPSATLDAEWSPHERGLLAVATSTGSIDIYKLEADTLSLHSSAQVAGASIIVLDLIWHPHKPGTTAFTLSSGEVQMCVSKDDTSWSAEMIDCRTITSHQLEPWTLAIGDQGLVYSGGDDAVLQCCNGADVTSLTQVWSDRKIHQAGVTAILPLREQLVVTGSYDDHIRLLHTPAFGRRRTLAELNLGGGVWRLKILESRGEDITILASCMHAGTRIVRLYRDPDADESWHFEVLARFEEHESMNYGSDVQPGPHAETTIISTSFYDRRVCLWRYSAGRA